MPLTRVSAEQRARVLIDAQLGAAGWVVQDGTALNLFAGPGVAVREVVMAHGHDRVDLLALRLVVGHRDRKTRGGRRLKSGQQVKRFLVDGTPGEPMSAEITNNPGTRSRRDDPTSRRAARTYSNIVIVDLCQQGKWIAYSRCPRPKLSLSW